MFVSKERAGMGEFPIPKEPSTPAQSATGESLLLALYTVAKISHTGLSERRALVRTWTPDELVRAHTTLRTRIVTQGSISHDDKSLLTAMEREGVEIGGKHSHSIGSIRARKIPHGPGLTLTNPDGETIAGWTKLSVWKVTNNNL